PSVPALAPLSLSYRSFASRRPPPTSTLFPYTTLFRSVYSKISGAMIISISLIALFLLFILTILFIFFLRRRSSGQQEDNGEEKRSEEHTSELQSRFDLVCRLLLEKKIYHIATTLR